MTDRYKGLTEAQALPARISAALLDVRKRGYEPTRILLGNEEYTQFNEWVTNKLFESPTGWVRTAHLPREPLVFHGHPVANVNLARHLEVTYEVRRALTRVY